MNDILERWNYFAV